MFSSMAVLKLRFSVAATASRYIDSASDTLERCGERRHGLQGSPPLGSVGQFNLRVGFRLSRARQGERVVDLERALNALLA